MCLQWNTPRRYELLVILDLFFLIYINDMSQAVKCNLFVYADDTCLVVQHKDINEFKKN